MALSSFGKMTGDSLSFNVHFIDYQIYANSTGIYSPHRSVSTLKIYGMSAIFQADRERPLDYSDIIPHHESYLQVVKVVCCLLHILISIFGMQEERKLNIAVNCLKFCMIFNEPLKVNKRDTFHNT